MKQVNGVCGDLRKQVGGERDTKQVNGDAGIKGAGKEKMGE